MKQRDGNFEWDNNKATELTQNVVRVLYSHDLAALAGASKELAPASAA